MTHTLPNPIRFCNGPEKPREFKYEEGFLEEGIWFWTEKGKILVVGQIHPVQCYNISPIQEQWSTLALTRSRIELSLKAPPNGIKQKRPFLMAISYIING